jgi:starch synthase
MYDLEFYGKINFMKSGILYSDAVNTVSKGYAREILAPEYGCGLEGVLMTRKSELFGITNGADYSEWDPQIDSHIKERYNSSTVGKKMDCKRDLLKSVNMNLPPDRPLLGVITRLARQKGIDLLADIMERLIDLDIGIILLGKGDEKYQNLFLKLSGEYPEHLSVHIKFDNALAHKIEAGSDMFLMPSRYEPCGLNQIYSLRYGTIPIVRATGGLDDIIVDFDEDRVRGNGFKFGPAAPDAFCKAIERAVRAFEDKLLWAGLTERVMKLDFSWEHSAKEYIELYENITKSGG